MHTGGVERGRCARQLERVPVWGQDPLGVLRSKTAEWVGESIREVGTTMARSSRNDMNEVYRKQTGREMSDTFSSN